MIIFVNIKIRFKCPVSIITHNSCLKKWHVKIVCMWQAAWHVSLWLVPVCAIWTMQVDHLFLIRQEITEVCKIYFYDYNCEISKNVKRFTGIAAEF
jgi:hypothetical protein